MAAGLHAGRRPRHHRVRDDESRTAPAGAVRRRRRRSMQWQTPQACDFRFGFEITMYVSAR